MRQWQSALGAADGTAATGTTVGNSGVLRLTGLAGDTIDVQNEVLTFSGTGVGLAGVSTKTSASSERDAAARAKASRSPAGTPATAKPSGWSSWCTRCCVPPYSGCV